MSEHTGIHMRVRFVAQVQPSRHATFPASAEMVALYDMVKAAADERGFKVTTVTLANYGEDDEVRFDLQRGEHVYYIVFGGLIDRVLAQPTIAKGLVEHEVANVHLLCCEAEAAEIAEDYGV